MKKDKPNAIRVPRATEKAPVVSEGTIPSTGRERTIINLATAVNTAPEQSVNLSSDIEAIAMNLDTARTLWQRYPDLVEEPELREPFKSALADSERCDTGSIGIDAEALQRILCAAKPMRKELDAKNFDLNVDLRERQFLTTCQALYRRKDGDATPFEYFVYSIVDRAGDGDEMTPECVLWYFEHFTETFGRLCETVVNLEKLYPTLFRKLKQARREAKEAA